MNFIIYFINKIYIYIVEKVQNLIKNYSSKNLNKLRRYDVIYEQISRVALTEFRITHPWIFHF